MIIGTGIDIVHIPRIHRAVERFGDRFVMRVFCNEETAWCMKKRDPYPCLAGRFAAKEAFVKALGTGFRDGIILSQICVLRLDMGAPGLKLANKASDMAQKKGVEKMHVSISHEREYAVAMVVLEGRGKKP